jgi:hypothetical protein
MYNSLVYLLLTSREHFSTSLLLSQLEPHTLTLLTSIESEALNSH